MNIQDYIDLLLSKKTKDGIVAAILGSERPKASSSDIKRLISDLNNHFHANQHREAVATALSLVMADADKTIASLRRHGYLRASRYDFQAGCVFKAVQAIYDVRHMLQVRPDRLVYLESVLAMHSLAPEIHKLRKGILTRLRPRKRIALKTLMVIINQLFAHGWIGSKHESALKLTHYGAEELTEAFSTILDLFRKNFELSNDLWNYVDELALQPTMSIYENMLIDAARINEFKTAETLIDGLPYRASIKGAMVTVSSIDPDLEKSVRHGYIQMDLQLALRASALYKAKADGNGPMSLSDFVQSAFEAGMGEMVQVKSKPFTRLVFGMIPTPEFFQPISANHLFLEDILSLLHLSVEDYNEDIIRVTKVNEHVSSMDILKIQRLFGFVSNVYQSKLASVEETWERKQLTLRSVIPIFQHDNLLSLISMVLPEGNAEEVLRLLTLDDAHDYVDLQYTPFIRMGEWYAVAPALLANSNLVRNIICFQNLRPNLIGITDPMQQAVVEALESAGFKVRSGFEANIDGKRETDILAWRDGVFFIFECKNAYHPCSAHEMRNSFDHIKTAGKQLDIRLDWLRDHAHQVALFRALGWDVPPTDEIQTSIIIANRVFNGYMQGRHPVRQAHELINVVLRGEIRLSEPERTLLFWKEPAFQTTDLVAYLRGETLIPDHFSMLQPIMHVIPFDQRSLGFESYFMDMKEVADQLMTRYPIKTTSPDTAEVSLP